jgi:hypothetical protein
MRGVSIAGAQAAAISFLLAAENSDGRIAGYEYKNDEKIERRQGLPSVIAWLSRWLGARRFTQIAAQDCRSIT